MRAIYNTLFSLIKDAISGDNKTINADSLTAENIKRLYSISSSHDLSHIVGKAVLNSGASMTDELRAAFKKSLSIAMYRYVQITRELGALCAALENAKIKHIPLKGSVLRNYYKEPWMRTSCDIDIFVDENDLERAISVLTDAGSYKFEERAAHDVSLYSASGVHIELHFNLVEGEKTKSILDNVWTHSTKAEGFEYKYEMDNELFVTYHIAHMARHFEFGGCGIRPLLDLWILSENMTFERGTVNAMLAECGLSAFYKAADKLMSVWFLGAEHTSLTLAMQDYIVDAGSYGTLENRIAIQQKRRGGKFAYVMKRIFMPYSQLKNYYPRLAKAPILYPYYQLKRWINFVFRKNKKRALMELSYNQKISDEKKNTLSALMSELELT